MNQLVGNTEGCDSEPWSLEVAFSFFVESVGLEAFACIDYILCASYSGVLPLLQVHPFIFFRNPSTDFMVKDQRDEGEGIDMYGSSPTFTL